VTLSSSLNGEFAEIPAGFGEHILSFQLGTGVIGPLS